MKKLELLKSTIILSILYIFYNSIIDGLYMATPLNLWITIYFILAYIKLYMPNLCGSVKLNIIISIMSLLGLVTLIALTNFLGLHYSILSNQNLHLASNNNPFLIAFAISLFLIVKSNKLAFTSIFVNYIASLTIFISLIHENFLIRRLCRALVWQYIHDCYSYEHVIFFCFCILSYYFCYLLY